MRVLSVNLGESRPVPYRGKTVMTAIFKEPVAGPVFVGAEQLAGDTQADLRVHGGPDKAVYAYPSEHYPAWSEWAGGRELAPGMFGENLTTEGLLESEVHIGDEFRIGSARLVVTQPRMPCYKLGIRFGDGGVLKAFLNAGKPGIYFAVREQGQVEAGDPIEKLGEDPARFSVAAMFDLIRQPRPDLDQVCRLLAIPALAKTWRESLEPLVQP
jgi:MOSC domain-containing protein YiiM